MSENANTARLVLLQLPPGYNSRAIKNHEAFCKENPHCRIHRQISLAGLIAGGFDWSATEEGWEFWDKVRLYANDPEVNKLPPLPDE